MGQDFSWQVAFLGGKGSPGCGPCLLSGRGWVSAAELMLFPLTAPPHKAYALDSRGQPALPQSPQTVCANMDGAVPSEQAYQGPGCSGLGQPRRSKGMWNCQGVPEFLATFPCRSPCWSLTNPLHNISFMTEIILKRPLDSEGGARRACLPPVR